jgi:hypothetical protein
VNPLVGGTGIGRGYSVVDRVIAFIGELRETRRELWRKRDRAIQASRRRRRGLGGALGGEGEVLQSAESFLAIGLGSSCETT